MATISRLVLAILLTLCVSHVFGHSYVTSPQTRSNQKQTNAGCRGPNCLGPCEVPVGKGNTPAVTIARGGSINVQWPRNNHAGGFIRFAWAPTSGSDVHSNFDSNVQEIHCHEVGGCGPDDTSMPNGGDSGPADGSKRACQTTIQVPAHLTDGDWTLQWAWFGGAFALGDYYSCIDYKISGGNYVQAKSDALFYGGDFTYPGQNKCKFFNTDRLHACVNEPCNNPVYTMYQEQSGPAYGVASAPSGNPKPTAPVTTNAAAAAPVTSGALTTKAATTRAATTQPLTTAPLTTQSSRVSLTTASKVAKPLTTATKVVPAATTGSKDTDTANLMNCGGLTTLVDSSAATISITTVDTWSNSFRMTIQIDVFADISDWMIQVIWPSEAVDTRIQHVYNAGDLLCSATYPTRHEMIDPVARWANNLKPGEQMLIELKASNTNMDAAFLKANTKIRMFKK